MEVKYIMTIKILKPPLTHAQLADAFEIRRIVFIDEQGFDPATDIDDTDPVAYHIVVYDAGRPVATARTFPHESGNDCYSIGRIAVLKEYRGTGMGKLIMREGEKLAAKLGARSFHLGAQMQATGFYRKFGYIEYGGTYYEEHCEHINMTKAL
jgi:predicted GNAT family N-acyltransferase